MKTIKIFYEAFIVLILYLAYYLAVKQGIPTEAYLVAGIAGTLYFVPVKIYKRLSSDSIHKKLDVVSSVIIAVLIILSFVSLYSPRVNDLKNVARVFFYLNIIVMLYSFFKAVEGRDYLVHIAMVFFSNEIVDRI